MNGSKRKQTVLKALTMIPMDRQIGRREGELSTFHYIRTVRSGGKSTAKKHQA